MMNGLKYRVRTLEIGKKKRSRGKSASFRSEAILSLLFCVVRPLLSYINLGSIRVRKPQNGWFCALSEPSVRFSFNELTFGKLLTRKRSLVRIQSWLMCSGLQILVERAHLSPFTNSAHFPFIDGAQLAEIRSREPGRQSVAQKLVLRWK